MLKSVMKHSASDDNIRHRVIPADVVLKWSKKVEELKGEVVAVLHEEKEEKQVRRGAIIRKMFSCTGSPSYSRRIWSLKRAKTCLSMRPRSSPDRQGPGFRLRRRRREQQVMHYPG